MADFNYIKTKARYRELDLNFGANPITGDINALTDEAAIKASLKNLVLMIHYDKPFHPEIGSGVRELLFENFTPITANHIKRKIEEVINNFEPRVQLIDVSVIAKIDRNLMEVSILFRIINTEEPVTLTFPLERLR